MQVGGPPERVLGSGEWLRPSRRTASYEAWRSILLLRQRRWAKLRLWAMTMRHCERLLAICQGPGVDGRWDWLQWAHIIAD